MFEQESDRQQPISRVQQRTSWPFLPTTQFDSDPAACFILFTWNACQQERKQVCGKQSSYWCADFCDSRDVEFCDNHDVDFAPEPQRPVKMEFKGSGSRERKRARQATAASSLCWGIATTDTEGERVQLAS